MKSKNPLIKITTTAVFIALTCVLALIVQIPSPTKGYMNLGDCAVLLGGYLLGPIYGTIAGGLGSAFADSFAGYPIYVTGTFIIKSLMALTVSLVPYLPSKKKKNFPRITFIFASLVAEMIIQCKCRYDKIGYGVYHAPHPANADKKQSIYDSI